MTNWVEKFFQDYADAFKAQSSSTLLAKFYLPLTFLTKSGPIVIGDDEHLSDNLDELKHRYEQIGAVDWNYEIKSVRAVGSGIHLVDIEWRFFNASHELLYACETSYFLAGEASAKVMAIIAHNEHEEYEKALNRKTGV